MDLNVLVIGKNFAETEPVLRFLNQNKIPHSHQIIEDFDSETPACYIGEFQHYGAENLERIKNFYQLTLNELRENSVFNL